MHSKSGTIPGARPSAISMPQRNPIPQLECPLDLISFQRKNKQHQPKHLALVFQHVPQNALISVFRGPFKRQLQTNPSVRLLPPDLTVKSNAKNAEISRTNSCLNSACMMRPAERCMARALGKVIGRHVTDASSGMYEIPPSMKILKCSSASWETRADSPAFTSAFLASLARCFRGSFSSIIGTSEMATGSREFSGPPTCHPPFPCLHSARHLRRNTSFSLATLQGTLCSS